MKIILPLFCTKMKIIFAKFYTKTKITQKKEVISTSIYNHTPYVIAAIARIKPTTQNNLIISVSLQPNSSK